MTRGDGKPRVPTIFDVAREAGVSYSTVSRTMNGYEFVKPSTREKVMQAAKRLGYVPNQQARSLAGGRSNLIGVLVPTLSNGYVTEVIRGIDEELAKSNYNLILYTTHRHHGKESIYVATIRNGGVDGLLLVAPLITIPYLDALRQQDFPYVLVDQLDSAQKSFSVSATNRQGACQATRYLIELGHRRIGFIAGLSGLYSAVERQEGYAAALADHGIPLCNDLIVQGEFSFEEGYSAVEKLLALEERPTAIFASNDLSAFGALEAIREHGLRIPDDISLLGFDDIPQASVTYPKLTTVRQPLEQMGRAAVAMLLDCIANPDQRSRQITLTTQLVIRDSCAPPPSQ
jgi:LacI family transcriptional regulator